MMDVWTNNLEYLIVENDSFANKCGVVDWKRALGILIQLET